MKLTATYIYLFRYCHYTIKRINCAKCISLGVDLKFDFKYIT